MSGYELLIGDIHDAANHEAMAARDVDAVLKLTHSDPERPYPEWVRVHDHPLVDGPQNEFSDFRRAVETLVDLFETGRTVLVHCSAGASRSVSVAAAGIAVVEGVALRDALATVEERRAVANPHPALVDQAERAVAALGEG